MRVEVKDRLPYSASIPPRRGQNREHDGWFKLDHYVLRHEGFNGTMSKPLSRLVFERGDSAAVLLYDSKRDTVVLVEQFRFPAYLRESAESLHLLAGAESLHLLAGAESLHLLAGAESLQLFAGAESLHLFAGEDGLLLEIVAGTVDAGKKPEDVARSELVEEAGYAVSSLEHVSTFYPSPGACTERIFLYLGHVVPADRIAAGGGVPASLCGGGKADTGEDIRVHEMPLAEAVRLVKEGAIRDAKTILALQYLMLEQQRNPR